MSHIEISSDEVSLANPSSHVYYDIHIMDYWKKKYPCRFFLREIGCSSDTIQKLHNGGARTFGQLETVDRDFLHLVGVTDTDEVSMVIAGKYFWTNRPAMCTLL